MHALFISNSEGSALKRTRSVLDRYATRIGAQTWETPITREALEEIQNALKNKATKNMSIACYINDFTHGMKLAWVVGNRNDYDSNGRYAMETHQKPPYIPYYIRLASKLAKTAGYCHDFGKIPLKFQSKLVPGKKKGAPPESSQKDPVRHEWLSERMLTYMLTHGLSPDALEAGFNALNPMSGGRKSKDAMVVPPFRHLVTCQDALKFCVVSHHRLFSSASTDHDAPPESHGAYNHVDKKKYADGSAHSVAQYQVKEGASITEAFSKTEIFNNVERILGELQEATPDNDPEYWHGLALIARAALILADHEVSSQENPDKKAIFHANSYRPAGKTKSVLNQNLVWHLENVGETAGRYAAVFSGYELPGIQHNDIETLSQGTDNKRFKWQDTAAAFIRENSDQPSLIFNIANTGAGKTRANMKFAEAARDERHPFRVTSAFNLRTLTLQTRDAYKHELGLSDEALACIVGDETTVKLHDTKWASDDDEGWSDPQNREKEDAEDGAMDVEYNVAWQGRIPGTVAEIVKNEKTGKLIAAPTLVCTMDQIIAAGEPGRQGIHAKALTRIVSSDLILDEIDSYDPKALMAVLRVVHTSAIFGRNIIVSSATLPPILAKALISVWRQGLRIHAKLNRKNADDTTGNIFAIADRVAPAIIHDADEYRVFAHDNASSADRITKRFRIEGVINQEDFLNKSVKCAHYLHSCNHSAHGDKRVSIGLVRVANIKQCLKVANYIRARADSAPDSTVFVTAYHSKEIIARRALKEKSLDLILNRKKDSDTWWNNSEETRAIVESTETRNIVFIVVATPVEEVGRDHDFDWAVIEPSSIGSIIQTAGRVNRHRRLDLSQSDSPNIIILDRAYHHLSSDPKDKNKIYSQPGHRIRDGVKTHCEGDEILPVSSMMPSSGVISTSLIFSDDRCRFAIEDERGIEYVIQGGLQAIQDNFSWMNDWMYKKFRLRDELSQISLRYDIKEEKLKWLTFNVRNGKSEAMENDITGRVPEYEIPGNTFFSWGVEDAVQEIMKMNGGGDIKEDDLTRLSLELYEATDRDISIDWAGVVVERDK
ncbi:helicases [Thiohalobacter thiocyanaticus]|uniref:Helicases n=1 Tax=Thiohalobacter thiocyanaticus TaxID=585455 RepID=A0A1Z4VQ03_9GAMM|nr:type I-F CRISPR-associated helicase Cas3f [Thiohalobacter thiocyanaticus]BAZ93719.1 helicases [Thiohalobacter thiocyanaticus]